eukprot:TRINITY_DN5498_c0_g1_i1.p1 TRINITY_DN5498_c0_g1~~TRINITY_DN5498_c0_g1_i1.p1  ORF type:complete len:103 (+),score=19.16 TRINITY_DN5498_c0_g1_i1:169-477(+)
MPRSLVQLEPAATNDANGSSHTISCSSSSGSKSSSRHAPSTSFDLKNTRHQKRGDGAAREVLCDALKTQFGSDTGLCASGSVRRNIRWFQQRHARQMKTLAR